MTPNRSVSVVICAHSLDRLERLKQAVASVQAQSLPALEIIVVIDHNPELLNLCRSLLNGIVLIENSRTQGLSGARNTGVLAARGDIVAFIDDDACAEPQWLLALTESYQSQFVMGVGGPITAVWPDKRPDWLAHEFDWVVGCSYRGQATEPDAMRNMFGCNMSFRRSALVMAGLFSEELGRVGQNAAGVEETELCLRARRLFPSAHFAHNPSARVDHHIEGYRASWRYFFRRCTAEGRSKAIMAAGAASRGSLNTERRHLLVTLPRAVAGYLGDAMQGRGLHGIARVASLVAGTALVVGSYILARVSSRRSEIAAAGFAPLKVCDIETALPPAAIDGRDEHGARRYGTAFCVIRDNGSLRGIQQIPTYGEILPGETLKTLLCGAADPARKVLAQPKARRRARVVVATRDRTEMLVKCLDSLLVQDHPDFEIVVVDNAPATRATRELIAERYPARVGYLHEPRPGLANAHNRGIADLRTEIVAFTDDDVIVDRAWLSTITAPFEDSDQIGCVTGAIVPAELETRAQYWTELHGGFLKGNQRQVFDLGKNRPPNPLFPYAVGQVGSGANMAYSRAALEAIGGFDPALGAGTTARGGDDLAGFFDVLKQGFQIVYMPDALVWHHHRRTETGMAQQALGYGIGLGAYLTRAVLRDPAALIHFILVAPRGLAHIFGASSDKNVRLPGDYPAALVWAERLGMLSGIPAYLRSRWASRRLPLDINTPPKTAWSEN